MELANAYTAALACTAVAFFLLGAGVGFVSLSADVALHRRIARKWRTEANQQRIERRRAEKLARRSPVEMFLDNRAAPVEYDPSLVRRYMDHPPARPVPGVRSPDDTQIIDRNDKTGDVT